MTDNNELHAHARAVSEAMIERADAATSDLPERRERNLGYVAPREQYQRRHAREPGLDTDLTALIDQRVEEALAIERPAMIEMMKGVTEALDDCAEKLAKFEARIEYVETVSKELERRALDPGVIEKLADTARKVQAQMVAVERSLGELRADTVVDSSPAARYLRDLN